MAVLSWGKPTVEIVESTDGTPGTPYVALPAIQEDTALLTTTKGDKKEATEEGGATIDVRYSANKYMFECELFVKNGDEKPIDDVDGVITDKYAVRLTPEDDTLEGWVMENASVSVEESWSSAIGKKWKYTFDGLKPAEGAILKPYTKPVA